jgi:hypothetical protein
VTLPDDVCLSDGKITSLARFRLAYDVSIPNDLVEATVA